MNMTIIAPAVTTENGRSGAAGGDRRRNISLPTACGRVAGRVEAAVVVLARTLALDAGDRLAVLIAVVAVMNRARSLGVSVSPGSAIVTRQARPVGPGSGARLADAAARCPSGSRVARELCGWHDLRDEPRVAFARTAYNLVAFATDGQPVARAGRKPTLPNLRLGRA